MALYSVLRDRSTLRVIYYTLTCYAVLTSYATLPEQSSIIRSAHKIPENHGVRCPKFYIRTPSKQPHILTHSVHKSGRQVRTPDIQTIRRSRIPHDRRLAIDLIAIAVMFQDELGRVEPIHTKVSLSLPPDDEKQTGRQAIKQTYQ